MAVALAVVWLVCTAGYTVAGGPVSDFPPAGSGSAPFVDRGPLSPPVVSCFVIDGDAALTTGRTVTLNNSCTNSPVEYMASEAADFAGAAWQAYDAAPVFTLSPGLGSKTVYFKVHNTASESVAVSDSIFGLRASPPAVELASSLTYHETTESGHCVSISGDRAVVGAFWADGLTTSSGAAFVYARQGGVWQEEAVLAAADGQMYDYFGWSVSVSGDTVVVGEPCDSTAGVFSGSAYVFTRQPGGFWSQQARLAAPDGGDDSRFGYSVSVSGDTLVVGAWLNSTQSGSAYVFTRTGSAWTLQAELMASDGEAYHYFGSSVSVLGDTAIIGAPGSDYDGVPAPGSAYVFTRSGNVWTEQPKLLASDGSAGDLFGSSVSFSDDTLVVGASSGDGLTTDTGSAYVFVRSGASWAEQAKLTAPDGQAKDSFGDSVSVSGDTVVVGASQEFFHTPSPGVAYVFTREGVTWTVAMKLTEPHPAQEDMFGLSVATELGQVLVGAPHRSDINGMGKVFSFDLGSLDPPGLSSFAIDGGAGSTTTRTVTLNSACTHWPAEYLASEAADFAGAMWKTYSAAAAFDLSMRNGTKTVFFKVRNTAGETPVTSGTIALTQPGWPGISSFAIDNGATETTGRIVTLDSTCTDSPTEYLASEAVDFGGASWLPYAAAPQFTLSSGNGTKTVYFRVRNAIDETGVTSDTIVLDEIIPLAPAVTTFAVDNGAAETTSTIVTLDNLCTNFPAEYQASEASDFGGAAWQAYATAPAFTLSAGNGTKTVYFKARNAGGESAVTSDTITLNVTVISGPSITAFAIEGGATETTGRIVTLDSSCTNSPTEYLASEAADFTGAGWQAYATAPAFVLSVGNGTKTVYFKVRSTSGESSVTSDTIVLNETVGVPPTVTSIAINGGDARTASPAVVLDSVCTGSPTEYLASEADDFTGATWHPYSTAPAFLLSEGEGVKTVHFKVRNTAGESSAASDTIVYSVADFTFIGQRIKSTHTEAWNRQAGAVAAKDKYSFSATAQLPTTFTLATLDADTTVTIMVGGLLFEDTLGHAAKKNIGTPDKSGSATFVLKADVNGKSRTVQTVKVSWTKKKTFKVSLAGTPMAGDGVAVHNIVAPAAESDGAIAPQVPTFVALGALYGEDAGVACSGWKKTKTASGAPGTNLISWSVSGKY